MSLRRFLLFVILTGFLAVIAPFVVDHPLAPTPIPGIIEEPLLARHLEQRMKNRHNKPFGTHPDARETQHPFTARAGSAGIHADAAASDVHRRGPTGQKSTMKVVTRVGSRFPGGMCATLTFNKNGYLIALCASLRRFELHMFEPKSLELLAMFPLPNRPSTYAMFMTLDPKKIMMDTSGGAYYFLDNEDRVVLGDANQHIRRIGHREVSSSLETDGKKKFEFYNVNDWDVSFMIPQDCMTWNNWFPSKNPEACDPITAVIPDFSGNIWFVTRRGIVGVLDPKIGKVIAKTHLHEEMQNGLTAGEDGVWIVTDEALYCMKVTPTLARNYQYKPHAETDGLDGSYLIQDVWSSKYDRGTFRKVGMLSVGSGTTPTLFDGRFVTITDNKDDQIQLLVYDLQEMKQQIKSGKKLVQFSSEKAAEVDGGAGGGGPLVCKHSLFEKDQSASDNSMIAVDGSIFMENNFGYHNAIEQRKFSKNQMPGGIERIDLIFENEDKSTSKVIGCKTVWKSKERAPSCVAKLGQEQGLLYCYTLEEGKILSDVDDDDDQQAETDSLNTEDDEEEASIEDDEDSSQEQGGFSSLVEWIFDFAGRSKNKNKKLPYWALTAVDAHTGETVFKIPTGRGRNFDNNWGPVTLGEDGTAYIGVIKGIIAIHDV